MTNFEARIADNEFEQFRKILYDIAGISLSPAKKALVISRLSKRLDHFGLNDFGAYLQMIRLKEHAAELQTTVDLLTTNETYFFREPKHFKFLQDYIDGTYKRGQPLRIWSAACSSGQEPYSIAMILQDMLGDAQWQIMASDISTQILAKAVKGLYPIAQAENIPQPYLKRFCLKGTGSHEGSFLVDKALRDKVSFFQANLNQALPGIGEFDLIFLRNVMIYFDTETKVEVVKRLQRVLKPGGYLIIGHSETLNGISDRFKMVLPAVYQNLD